MLWQHYFVHDTFSSANAASRVSLKAVVPVRALRSALATVQAAAPVVVRGARSVH